MTAGQETRDLSRVPAEDLHGQLRDWLGRELPPDRWTCLGMAGGHDAHFLRRLGEAGCLGLSVPPRYGRHGGTAVQQFIVTEELLAAQALVGTHWLADRQVAPSIIAVGTEEQRQTFLPRIVRGDRYFSIGPSEPDAGSDLSPVRTKAQRVHRGWWVSDTKIWTTFAQYNHFLLALCRSEPSSEDRHAGMSQFIINSKAGGVHVRPIRTMDGAAEFCEVVLDHVFVPENRLLGQQGDRWRQAGAEPSDMAIHPEPTDPVHCGSQRTSRRRWTLPCAGMRSAVRLPGSDILRAICLFGGPSRNGRHVAVARSDRSTPGASDVLYRAPVIGRRSNATEFGFSRGR